MKKPTKIAEILTQDSIAIFVCDPITIFDLKYTTCRYIIKEGDPTEKIYCGDLVDRGSYCKKHYRICYVKAKK